MIPITAADQHTCAAIDTADNDYRASNPFHDLAKATPTTSTLAHAFAPATTAEPNPDGLEGVRSLQWKRSHETSTRSAPNIPNGEQGSLGRANWIRSAYPASSSADNASERQRIYEKWFARSAYELAQRIQLAIYDIDPNNSNRPIDGILALWTAAMEHRATVGWALRNHVNVSLRVGSPDTMNAFPSSMVTPLTGRYETQVRHIIEALLAKETPDTDDFTYERTSSQSNDQLYQINAPAIDLHSVAVRYRNPQGELRPLTESVLPVVPDTPPRFSDPFIDYVAVMHHAMPSLIVELMVKAHEHASAALDPVTPAIRAREHIARFMWHLYHACPSERGSAAITDLCANALFLARGDTPHRWPQNVVGDLEALLRNETMWVDHFLTIGFEPALPEHTDHHDRLRATLQAVD